MNRSNAAAVAAILTIAGGTMRSSFRVLIAALAFIPAVSASAQVTRSIATGGAAPAADPVLPAGTCCLSKLTVVEADRLARRIDQADLLTIEGRFAEARTILRQVADEQAKADAYPAAALRRLANVEFGLGKPMAAAKVLEELANAANAVSDPPTELQALVDATVLYGQEGRRAKARELRPRIMRLLDSPAISEEMRRNIARHLDHE